MVYISKQFPDYKVAFTFRVDSVAYEKSKIIAKKEFRSLNNLLEYFILKSVEEYEKENGEININDI